MREYDVKELQSSTFPHDWTFICLCVKEKMRKRGIQSIRLSGYYSPATHKEKQQTWKGDTDE